LINSELATNNKQVLVINDDFTSVGGDQGEFIAKDKTSRVGGDVTSILGVLDEKQLEAFSEWKSVYAPLAQLNSEFKIKRGIEGERADNPVLKTKMIAVENEFKGYNGIPVRTSNADQVVTYVTVNDRDNIQIASPKELTVDQIEKSAGLTGSNSSVSFRGAEKSAATEEGEWEKNEEAEKLPDKILELQETLSPIERKMGVGGDKVEFIKRNKMETIGAVLNDYPSVRVDEEGRSQPFEMLVADKGTFKNHEAMPHIEEVDNSSNFPGGRKTTVINNKWDLFIGSGGMNLKTLGNVEFGGSTFKGAFKKINLTASHGLHIASDQQVEIQSIKSVVLRSNRQILVESALGVKDNIVVGGGSYTEGETYLHHITAPLEVHQTQDTVVFGKFATDQDRRLKIGEADLGGVYYPVYAMASDNLICNYPHSHHHNGIPMRLMKSNSDVRKIAQDEGINNHSNITQAFPQVHERKLALEVEDQD
jgi:hypothetical protein